MVEEQYRNMREILDQHPTIAEHAREAIRRAGLEPRMRPIRGGTDGSRLSFAGAPDTKFVRQANRTSSRLEWVAVSDMELAVR
jgi:tripeptide aminopeptidase